MEGNAQLQRGRGGPATMTGVAGGTSGSSTNAIRPQHTGRATASSNSSGNRQQPAAIRSNSTTSPYLQQQGMRSVARPAADATSTEAHHCGSAGVAHATRMQAATSDLFHNTAGAVGNAGAAHSVTPTGLPSNAMRSQAAPAASQRSTHSYSNHQLDGHLAEATVSSGSNGTSGPRVRGASGVPSTAQLMNSATLPSSPMAHFHARHSALREPPALPASPGVTHSASHSMSHSPAASPATTRSLQHSPYANNATKRVQGSSVSAGGAGNGSFSSQSAASAATLTGQTRSSTVGMQHRGRRAAIQPSAQLSSGTGSTLSQHQGKASFNFVSSRPVAVPDGVDVLAPAVHSSQLLAAQTHTSQSAGDYSMTRRNTSRHSYADNAVMIVDNTAAAAAAAAAAGNHMDSITGMMLTRPVLQPPVGSWQPPATSSFTNQNTLQSCSTASPGNPSTPQQQHVQGVRGFGPAMLGGAAQPASINTPQQQAACGMQGSSWGNGISQQEPLGARASWPVGAASRNSYASNATTGLNVLSNLALGTADVAVQQAGSGSGGAHSQEGPGAPWDSNWLARLIGDESLAEGNGELGSGTESHDHTGHSYSTDVDSQRRNLDLTGHSQDLTRQGRTLDLDSQRPQDVSSGSVPATGGPNSALGDSNLGQQGPQGAAAVLPLWLQEDEHLLSSLTMFAGVNQPVSGTAALPGVGLNTLLPGTGARQALPGTTGLNAQALPATGAGSSAMGSRRISSGGSSRGVERACPSGSSNTNAIRLLPGRPHQLPSGSSHDQDHHQQTQQQRQQQQQDRNSSNQAAIRAHDQPSSSSSRPTEGSSSSNNNNNRSVELSSRNSGAEPNRVSRHVVSYSAGLRNRHVVSYSAGEGPRRSMPTAPSEPQLITAPSSEAPLASRGSDRLDSVDSTRGSLQDRDRTALVDAAGGAAGTRNGSARRRPAPATANLPSASGVTLPGSAAYQSAFRDALAQRDRQRATLLASLREEPAPASAPTAPTASSAVAPDLLQEAEDLQLAIALQLSLREAGLSSPPASPPATAAATHQQGDINIPQSIQPTAAATTHQGGSVLALPPALWSVPHQPGPLPNMTLLPNDNLHASATTAVRSPGSGYAAEEAAQLWPAASLSHPAVQHQQQAQPPIRSAAPVAVSFTANSRSHTSAQSPNNDMSAQQEAGTAAAIDSRLYTGIDGGAAFGGTAFNNTVLGSNGDSGARRRARAVHMFEAHDGLGALPGEGTRPSLSSLLASLPVGPLDDHGLPTTLPGTLLAALLGSMADRNPAAARLGDALFQPPTRDHATALQPSSSRQGQQQAAQQDSRSAMSTASEYNSTATLPGTDGQAGFASLRPAANAVDEFSAGRVWPGGPMLLQGLLDSSGIASHSRGLAGSASAFTDQEGADGDDPVSLAGRPPRRAALLMRAVRSDGQGDWFLGIPGEGGSLLGAVHLGMTRAPGRLFSDYMNLDDMTYERLVQLENVVVPTPANVLAALPRSTYEAGDSCTFDGPCPICMEEYAPGQCLVHLPCKHAYHDGCIQVWLGQHSKLCPVCKASVVGDLNVQRAR